MRFLWSRKKAGEREEAKQALIEAKVQAARIHEKTTRDAGLFMRLAEIRKTNHIAERVQEILEGR